MKLQELYEARGVEQITIRNLAGYTKKFKQIDGAWEKPTEAKAWMKSHDNPNLDRELAVKSRKSKVLTIDRDDKVKVDLAAVYRKIIDVIGNSFPDGDPIDLMIPYMKKIGVKDWDIGDTINAAMKKHGHGLEKKGMYAYMASMWKEMSEDALVDAKEMMSKTGKEYDSPFIRYENGKPIVISNPY